LRIRLGIYSENNGLLCHLATTTHNRPSAQESATLTMQRVTKCSETIYDDDVWWWRTDIRQRASMHDDDVGLHTAVTSCDNEWQRMTTMMTAKCSRKLLL